MERKPEPLGPEYNNFACGKTDILTRIGFQRGLNDTSTLDQKELNKRDAFSTCFTRIALNNGQINKILYIYIMYKYKYI